MKYIYSVMVSARGCPGSTCIGPVWLDKCNLQMFIYIYIHYALCSDSLGCYPLMVRWLFRALSVRARRCVSRRLVEVLFTAEVVDAWCGRGEGQQPNRASGAMHVGLGPLPS